MSVKSTIQRDPLSSVFLKIILLLLVVLISACVTLYATNSVKNQLAARLSDIRKLESQECERRMTENVNKYQEELRDKLEKEYKDKLSGSQGDSDRENIFSRGNAHQESQQEIILLKAKLEKMERQYLLMTGKFNEANEEVQKLKKASEGADK